MVKVGDTIVADQSLITLESDKASMEIPSPAAGVVESISVKLDPGQVPGGVNRVPVAGVLSARIRVMSAHPAPTGNPRPGWATPLFGPSATRWNARNWRCANSPPKPMARP